MDEVNRRIIAYIFSGIIGSIMVYIGAKSIVLRLPTEDIMLIEGILGSIEAGFIMLIRYNFKLKIGDKKIPTGVLPPESTEPEVPVAPVVILEPEKPIT